MVEKQRINYQAKSIRTFIGAKDFAVSRAFYTTLGFQETVISAKLSLFRVNDKLAFYLQDYYIQDWCDNSMVFLEVGNVQECWEVIKKLDLPKTYKTVRLSTIKTLDWGKEFFLHDPVGVLWHIGQFN